MPLVQKVTGIGVASGLGTASVLATLKPPYDLIQAGSSNTATGASITFAATIGKSWMISWIHAQVSAFGAVLPEYGSNLSCGGYNVTNLALTGVLGSIWEQDFPDLAWLFGVNTAVTIQINLAQGVARYSSLIAGAYLI